MLRGCSVIQRTTEWLYEINIGNKTICLMTILKVHVEHTRTMYTKL